MTRSSLVLAVSALSLFAFGCSGNYRVVKKTQTGGEVALQGPQESARQKADEYMASQCAGGYDVVEEGEAVVGQTTSANTHDNGKNIFGQRSTTTNATSQDLREWRIKYQCKGTAAEKTGAAQEVVIYF